MVSAGHGMRVVLTVSFGQVETEFEVSYIRQGRRTVGCYGVAVGPTGLLIVKTPVEIVANRTSIFEKRNLFLVCWLIRILGTKISKTRGSQSQ